jgi:hypothetical protein
MIRLSRTRDLSNRRNPWVIAMAVAVASGIGGVVITTAHAQQNVIVNGELLSPEQVAELERAHCGPVPDGDYWLDVSTGVWGYAGDPSAQGNLFDNCRRPSLSERRLLYRPGEILGR